MNTRRVCVCVLAAALAAGATVARSADATFEASVDRNQVALGEQFSLSFVLGNAGMGGGKNLQLPDLSRFHIMAGPNQSSSMQFVNGAVSSSVSYAYVLQPKEPGRFTIGAASIEVSGSVLRSQPLTIEVVQGAGRSSPPAGPQGGGGGAESQLEGNIFLRASVDRSRLIQGEQVNLTFKLYTRVSVSNYAVQKNPAMKGFWGEDVENPRNITLATETVDGRQYRVGVIRKMALFPTQSGDLEISPMEVQATVQVQSRRLFDPLDSFFQDPFGRTVNTTVASEPLKIRVDPLPGGAPAGFGGAVGRFAMSTETDRKTVRADEPVSLRITISGAGNLKLLESPAVEFPPDFEQYAPKVTENITRREGKIAGSKTFEYLMIPRYPGRKTLRPVTFVFFDPARGEYVTLRSAPLELTVEPGAAPRAESSPGDRREDVTLLSRDIRYIRLADDGLRRKGEYVYRDPLFLLLLALPAGGWAAAFVAARKRREERSDEAGTRSRKAYRTARRRLREAGTAEVSSCVARALWTYLGDRLGIPPAEMSLERAAAELEARSRDPGAAAALRELLERCEQERFAPPASGSAAGRQRTDEARRVLDRIERSLP
ncbi:MAG: BatD family protein [Bacteroidota bacterium]